MQTKAGQTGESQPPRSADVKSAARVLEILELMSSGDRPRRSLGDIAATLSIPKSSLHGILRTMQSHGWVEVDASGSLYSLGLSSLRTGTAYLEGDDVTALATPVLDRLADETGETVHLGRLDGVDVVYLAKRESRHALRMFSAVGRRLPAHATALGKAILATFNDDEVLRRLNWPLERLTESTIVEPEALLAELRTIRERGWSLDDGENASDIRCVAVALTSTRPGSDALSCSVPISRMDDARLPEIVAAVRAQAQWLGSLCQRMGHY
jgi:DNA-binding IclR family transcriptional regulator